MDQWLDNSSIWNWVETWWFLRQDKLGEVKVLALQLLCLLMTISEDPLIWFMNQFKHVKYNWIGEPWLLRSTIWIATYATGFILEWLYTIHTSAETIHYQWYPTHCILHLQQRDLGCHQPMQRMSVANQWCESNHVTHELCEQNWSGDKKQVDPLILIGWCW